MMTTLKEKRTEAILRMEAMVEALNLNPILNELRDGERYCSNADCMENNIYPIASDLDLVNLVMEFEKKRNAYVYHVIEDGALLVFLYVNDYKEEWEVARYSTAGFISSYVYNLIFPELSEYGDVFIEESNGAIKRIN